jgi:hypothetical protein
MDTDSPRLLASRATQLPKRSRVGRPRPLRCREAISHRHRGGRRNGDLTGGSSPGDQKAAVLPPTQSDAVSWGDRAQGGRHAIQQRDRPPAGVTGEAAAPSRARGAAHGPIRILGGDGDDELHVDAGPGEIMVDGGAGNDTLSALFGTVLGGPGDDLIGLPGSVTRPGGPTVDCGPGADRVTAVASSLARSAVRADPATCPALLRPLGQFAETRFGLPSVRAGADRKVRSPCSARRRRSAAGSALPSATAGRAPRPRASARRRSGRSGSRSSCAPRPFAERSRRARSVAPSPSAAPTTTARRSGIREGTPAW